MRPESWLRRWLRSRWEGELGLSLEWQEPGFGSSVGLADVRLKLSREAGGGELPVELKWWEYKTRKGALCCKVRPAQIRYHVMEDRGGRRTALLAGSRVSTETKIWMIPGHRCPREPYPKDEGIGWMEVEGAESLLKAVERVLSGDFN